MAGVVNRHTAIGLSAVIAFGNFIFTLVGLYLVEKSGRRKLILLSLAAVVVSLVVLGLAFFLSNAGSPAAFAPTELNTSVSSVDGCRATRTACSLWRNCDDCVNSGEGCHYCVFNGSFNSQEAVGLCVSKENHFFYTDNRGGECILPEGNLLSYTDHRSNNQCYSLQLGNTTVSSFAFCPSRFAWLTLAALFMYIMSFSPGMGPVPWTVNAEIYPNWARSAGCSVATTTNWVSNLLVSITFLHLTQYLTRYGAFWLYTGIAAAGWLFIFLLLPETRGRPLERVEELFQRPLCPPPGLGSCSGGQCSRQVYLRLKQSERSGYGTGTLLEANGTPQLTEDLTNNHFH